MTNGTRLLVFAGCLLVSFALFNCADPLDITNQPVPPNQNPSDTLFVIDTVHVIDTVTRTEFDTTFVIDTVFNNQLDTVLIVDTVMQNHYDTTYIVDTVHHGRVDTVVVVDTVMQNHYDTTYVVDTVFLDHVDTVVVIDSVMVTDPDTITIVDTIYQTDTLTVIDTVIVTTDTTQMMCGRIEANQKEIVWLLQNEPGLYHLSFAAYIESDQPPQSLTVEIGENTYSWNTATSTDMAVDLELGADASIIITSQKPPARGHAVYVCLSIVRQ